jgi:hypothetical protein
MIMNSNKWDQSNFQEAEDNFLDPDYKYPWEKLSDNRFPQEEEEENDNGDTNYER